METTIFKKEKILSLKSNIKKIAEVLKQSKKEYKQAQRDGDFHKQWKIGPSIYANKLYIRQRYIAYALMKGKTYEQIESRVREGNVPNWKIIKGIQDECSN